MSVEAPEDVVGLSGAAADPEANDPAAATRRELLIDAGRIDPATAFVGNEVGLLYPEEFLLADQNGDGLLDLTLVFSADQARALMNFWEEENRNNFV